MEFFIKKVLWKIHTNSKQYGGFLSSYSTSFRVYRKDWKRGSSACLARGRNNFTRAAVVIEKKYSDEKAYSLGQTISNYIDFEDR